MTMSSNGLWKVNAQPPSIMGHIARSLSSGILPLSSPHQASQVEPIDFSQKSEPTTPSDSSFNHDGEIRKKFKTENGSVPQNVYARNGYPNDSRGYADLDQYYSVRDKDTFARQQNGMLNEIEKNDHESAELVLPLTRDSSPKVENGIPLTYMGAIRSPASCPRSDVTSSRASPRSSADDTHRVNLSYPSSPDTDSNMTNGRGHLRSPDAIVNNMSVRNVEEVSSPHMNEHLPNFMVPSTSSDAAHLAGDSVSFSPAGMLNDRRHPKLPQLAIPIMNPLNVRKSNGYSSGPSTSAALLPFQVAVSPPTAAYEDPMRVVHLPNPWPVSSPYMKTSILQAQLEDKKSIKQVRPFKAYSNDIINSCYPGMRTASMGVGSSANFEQFIKLRSDCLDQMNKNAGRGEVDSKKENLSELTTTSDTTKYDCQSTTTTTSNGCVETSSSPEMKGNYSNDSSLSPRNDESQQQSSDNGNGGNGGRRRGNRYPENEKDPAYWERRKKNNEAAKRSRDARRRKEDALAMTAKELLEDKVKMTMHITFQMREIQKLEKENQFLKDKELTLKNYVYHLENRCRDCSLCSNRNPDKRPV